jgi:predicted house-cleaning noncanonical NTP pyrophosphatase (MazG superfamily)
LDDETYLRMADAKLDEELAEYHESHSLEELADLLEVIYAVAQARGYTLEELESFRAKKAEARGAFQKKILLRDVVIE